MFLNKRLHEQLVITQLFLSFLK